MFKNADELLRGIRPGIINPGSAGSIDTTVPTEEDTCEDTPTCPADSTSSCVVQAMSAELPSVQVADDACVTRADQPANRPNENCKSIEGESA